MAIDNISPEERLFNVIRQVKESPPGAEDYKNKGILGRIRRFIIDLIPKPGAKPARGFRVFPIIFHEIDLKAVNKILAAALLVFMALIIYYSVSGRPNMLKLTSSIAMVESQMIRQRSANVFKPLDYYERLIKKRDIFKPSPSEMAATPAPVETGKLKEIAKDLKLVGISWGSIPKAMIKDEKEGRIYFLMEGQKIGTTGIEIKAVLKDKAILAYQAEEMELR